MRTSTVVGRRSFVFAVLVAEGTFRGGHAVDTWLNVTTRHVASYGGCSIDFRGGAVAKSR